MEHFRWTPDLTTWHRQARGTYASNDGLSCARRQLNGRWVCSIRPDLESKWQESPYRWGALHAAQSECRRMHAKLRSAEEA